MPLLDPDLLRHLSRLEILARRVERGALSGERLSHALGRSLDFAQHREYILGDDLRYIDWNVYARQERYVVKEFQAEADLQVYLLVDVSESMNFGNPTKAYRAQQLAAAIGYVALGGLDQAHAYGLAAGLTASLPGLRGRGQVSTLCAFLERLPVGGRTDLLGGIRTFAARDPMPGLAVLLSDCWDLAGFQEAVRLLRFHKHDVVVVQVLAPEELEPHLSGDVELVDSESGDTLVMTATPRSVREYQAALRRATLAMQRFVSRQGGRFLQVAPGAPVEGVVRDVLRGGGLLL